MDWPFEDIPKGKARVVLADPPWDFKSNSKKNPGRNARRHYGCMSIDDIAALPVGDIAADNCALFLWITGPMLLIGAHLPLMKAWGFKPSGMGFVWIKTDKSTPPEQVTFTPNDLFWGGGFTTRKNAEFCLIGKRGRSVRQDAGVHEIIIAPRREHSRKPDETYARIEKYTDGPYVELFARESRRGWKTWGDESQKFDRAAA